MDRVQRANIFSSFDSLRGFKDMLAKQEKEVVTKRVLFEDDIDELNRRINQIQKGMMITLEYYDKDEILKIKGIVARINLTTREIQVVKKKINLNNIVWIEIER